MTETLIAHLEAMKERFPTGDLANPTPLQTEIIRLNRQTMAELNEAVALANGVTASVRAAVSPVVHWFQSDEQPDRPLEEVLRMIVEELERDRNQLLHKERLEREASSVGEDTPLRASVVAGELVVRIGVRTLAVATASGGVFHQEDDDGDEVRKFAILDPLQFAKDVANELEREEEDGSSPLSDVVDRAAQAAIDEGSLAVDYEQRIQLGEHAKCETWWPKGDQQP